MELWKALDKRYRGAKSDVVRVIPRKDLNILGIEELCGSPA